MSRKRRRRAQRPPDIDFTATVKAEEMRFREVPDTDVRLSGSPDHDGESGSERMNLADEVEPGVTYRNVRVDYRLANRLIDRGSGKPEADS